MSLGTGRDGRESCRTGVTVRSFEDLEVWKRGCRLAVEVYQALGESKDFALADQMRRSAVSVSSNIAEGYERPTKDYARFLTYSLGSLAELRTQAYIAEKVDTISPEARRHIVTECQTISRMIQSHG